MNWKKKVAVAALAFFMSTSLMSPTVTQAQDAPRIFINGQELFMEVPGLIHNNRTMVPFRAIMEALDATVNWNDETKTVLAHKGQTDITLQIDNKIAWVNTKMVGLDAPPIIVFGRTMVPVRFVAESLGETVDWDAERRMVKITSSEPESDPEPTTPSQIEEHPSGTILSEDTSFKYAYNSMVTLKKGTRVEFFNNGLVSEGTLAEDSMLKFDGTTSAQFKAGTLIKFSQTGQVIKGTLLQDTSLPYLRTRPNVGLPFYNTDGMSTTFKGGTEVTLVEGKIISGTLLKDTTLRYQYGALTEFLAGTIVDFDDNSMVRKGTLAVPTKLQIIHDNLTKGDTHIEFKERTPINFKENGYVESGILREDTELQYNHDKWATFAKDTMVTFNSKGYVRIGTLGKYAKLEYANRQEHGFGEGKEVMFNDDGYVVSGTLGTDLNTQGGVFRSDHPILFWDNGKIRSATLRYESSLEYAVNQKVDLLMDSQVEFHENGYLAKGLLKYHSSLPYTNRHYSNLATFKGETIIEFDNQGLVSKGILNKDIVMEYASKKSTTFKAGEIELFNGYVERGTLQHDTELENISGEKMVYPANATVTFNPNGLVISVLD